MRFYLSSYKLGNQTEKLRGLIPRNNNRFAYIPNALDFTNADQERRRKHIQNDMNDLRLVGIVPESLDLREYFLNQDGLAKKLGELGGLWISGGNTFILRQAMKLSGLDEILKGNSLRADFLYGGYSAAGCVLSPNLRAYEIVDDPTDLPYPESREVIWEGLGLIDFAFMPHFDSEHPESADIGKEIQYCKEKGLPFKALRDGEVIIF